VEFGAGFASAAMRGSQNNDPFRIEDGKVVTSTNNCGGILGGITDGMPLVFRAAVKPTPSIGQVQQSVDLQTMQNTELTVNGRHDPCIVPRAVPVVEAMTAIALMNIL
jgi:chorismate synthase